MNLTQKILREFELRSYNIFLTLAIKSSKPLNQIKKKEKQKNHPKTLGIKLLVVYTVFGLWDLGPWITNTTGLLYPNTLLPKNPPTSSSLTHRLDSRAFITHQSFFSTAAATISILFDYYRRLLIDQIPFCMIVIFC